MINMQTKYFNILMKEVPNTTKKETVKIPIIIS